MQLIILLLFERLEQENTVMLSIKICRVVDTGAMKNIADY